MSQAKTSQLVKAVAYSSNNSNQENEWSQSTQQQHRSMMNNTIVDQWSANNHQLDDILFEPKVILTIYL